MYGSFRAAILSYIWMGIRIKIRIRTNWRFWNISLFISYLTEVQTSNVSLIIDSVHTFSDVRVQINVQKGYSPSSGTTAQRSEARNKKRRDQRNQIVSNFYWKCFILSLLFLCIYLMFTFHWLLFYSFISLMLVISCNSLLLNNLISLQFLSIKNVYIVKFNTVSIW